MSAPTDYQIIAKIYESPNSLVYRAIHSQNHQPLILKILKKDYPAPSELTRYKQEYEITRSLALDGVIKAYDLHRHQNSLVMLLEDFGGESLKILMGKHKFTLWEFLPIAIKTTEILGAIHTANIIHKDINPSNIVYNLETRQLKIIDFGISTVLSRENPAIRHPNQLEGTLAYISPEQTGRMNRTLDYRSDFYSLGVTFYELLTHQLPFETADAVELVHCHIARQPVPPHERNNGIPIAVSNMVMKLLAKTAEERYQSTRGLKADLEACLHQLQASAEISVFPLARQDISDKFQIPQKLYGRQKEVTQLLSTFERVSQGKTEMVLVSGYSGIGKSALVNEVHKPIVRQRGYFISGKFDQFKRDIPYTSLIQAFQDLIRQLLTESEAVLQTWKQKLLKALGNIGQVIIDVIPEVKLIIGEQPPVPQLGSTESQNRFNLVFQKFIGVFSKKEHPLVIFLDDLQWADSPSLKLIELLMTDTDSQYLLMIGAYRDNEVSTGHPLMLTLEQIQKVGVKVNSITLQPLEIEQVNRLIADTLSCSTQASKPLAKLVHNKTDGNPFFLTQLLQSLYTENLLSFDVIAGSWRWEIEEIETVGITDNVVNLMIGKIEKLDENTQNVLKLAACIGNRFGLEVLSVVNTKSLSETATALWPALQEGLIVPLSNDYKIPMLWNQESGSVGNSETSSSFILHYPSSIPYRFLHDRVQQAAYALIPEEHKKQVHLKVGQQLLKNTQPDELPENIFDIVNQLNKAAELITHQSERYNLAQLNLIAGKKAKASTAYEPALKYLEAGLTLLASDSWQHQYKLTLELYVETVEAHYLNTQFEAAEKLSAIVLQKARVLVDKVKVYEVKIQALQAQNQPKEAIKTALDVLNLLGVNFPKSPTLLKLFNWLDLRQTKLSLLWKQTETLIHLPEINDPLKLAAIRILSSVDSAAYIAYPELYSPIVLKGLNLLLKHGNASDSALVYANYAVITCGLIGDIEPGYRFSELALSLIERFNSKVVKGKLIFLIGYIQHWKKPIKEISKFFLEEAYKSGLENGDVVFAGYSIHQYCLHSYWAGHELKKLEKEIGTSSQIIEKIKQYTSLNYNKIYHQAVLNLIGNTENPWTLIGEAYHEQEMLTIHLEANDRLAIFNLYFNKLVLGYLFNDYAQALENLALAEKYVDAVMGSLSIPLFYFYNSLIRLAVIAKSSLSKHQLLQVKANQIKMKRWADSAPENYQNKYELVEAEKARALGKNIIAMEYYERAIRGARKQEFIQEEAIAYERAAELYLSIGREEMAQLYIKNAHHCYARWGAIAKVKDLESKYPQFLVEAASRREVKGISTTTSNTGSDAEALDLITVIKASQALAGEIVLEKLLKKLMKIVIENAGAQKGFLILNKEDSLAIEAEGAVGEGDVTILQSIPVDSVDVSTQLPLLSAAIINYVVHSQENVVLNDATHEGQFTSDPYIVATQPKSILCTPLLNQAKLIGILYLENNLTMGAFIPERVEILKLLSSQIAISIENSSLYKQLEDYSRTLEIKVETRTQELKEKNQELETTLQKLKATQAQIIAQEKLASLGALTAGIAHEIKNPLNFVNNFAELSAELTQELLEEIENQKDRLESETREYIEEILKDLKQNAKKINEHGKRADNIVRGMLMHSRGQSGNRQLTDINALLAESINLAYHGMRAKEPYFNIALETSYDDGLGQVNVVPQNISRVFLNIINNACYAAYEKKKEIGDGFYPKLLVSTKDLNERVEIRIRDNGKGIPHQALDKIFNPFFTTKPPGQGTGLGLSISHDIIVQEHQGEIIVETETDNFTQFIINIPKYNNGDK
ncbi:MAG: AAA family ATPase [Aphanothece sp. CMT-3BRIN-NPC111]|jgi:predicted ATPase/signal transduction histidine kinase/tRNA A-37 threonylcarbamoyl transferase component Bud32|nr:AAA family ATPase [Aphanothece sp. CMT-3BRIN-NPC111]